MITGECLLGHSLQLFYTSCVNLENFLNVDCTTRYSKDINLHDTECLNFNFIFEIIL